MRSGLSALLLVVLVTSCGAAPVDVTPLLETLKQTGKLELLVELDQTQLPELPHGIVVKRAWKHVPMVHVTLTAPDALLALASVPGVVRVHEDKPMHHFLAESLPLVGQPEAAAAGALGTGTSVAVLDTGADITQPEFRCGDTCPVTVLPDIAPDDGEADDDGHGTNVAGIVHGMAPGAEVLMLDVFQHDHTAFTSDVISGIDWVIEHRAEHNIVAVNLSLGVADGYAAPCADDAMAPVITRAREAGIITVVASGNDGKIGEISSPACVPAAVSVGAVYDAQLGPLRTSLCSDPAPTTDGVACFSNSAPYLSLLAPGAPITAAGWTMAGTSQASPHVAGAIAVLAGEHGHPEESVDARIHRLVATGHPVTDPRNGLTFPRLDVAAALHADFSPPAAEPEAPPVAEPSDPLEVTVTVRHDARGWLVSWSGFTPELDVVLVGANHPIDAGCANGKRLYQGHGSTWAFPDSPAYVRVCSIDASGQLSEGVMVQRSRSRITRASGPNRPAQ